MSARAIVVGAGIVGAACAEALAMDGWSVRVLEGARTASGATAAGMGHVLVLDDSEAQLALTRLSRDLWDRRGDAWPREVERETCGTLWVAADDEELAAARARHAWYRAREVACELVEGPQLRALEPGLRPGLAGALHIPGDSVVYPIAATEHLLARARARGATVQHGVKVERVGDGWVRTAAGARLEADLVVVAAGLDTLELLEDCPPGLILRPKRGHLAITERALGFLRHQVIELGYLKSAHGSLPSSVAFNAQPRATGQILLGSSREQDEAGERVDATVLARMVARGIEYLPGLRDLRVLRAWVGLRPATADNLPLIGPLPGSPRLFVAAGHEGLGITTSLGTARLVGDLAAGREPPIDARPYAVERLGAGMAHA